MWTPGDPHVREGVCIGLAELINATTKARIAELTARLTISTIFPYLYDSICICNILCVWLDLLSLRENYFGRCLYLNTTIDWWNATEFGNFFVLRIGQDLLTAYLDQLIPAIQQAIIDDDDSVRNQASTAPWLKMAIHNFLHKPANPEVKDIIRYPRHVSSKET